MLARSQAKFDKLVSEKGWPDEQVHFIAMDLANVDAIRKAAIEANEWAGGCADILVNNGKM